MYTNMLDRLITTLIVDDEPMARQIMREELGVMSRIDLIGEANDGKEPLRKIIDLQPDLVFSISNCPDQRFRGCPAAERRSSASSLRPRTMNILSRPLKSEP